MKKIMAAVLIILAFATVSSAASDWQSTVAEVGNRVRITQDGAKVLHSFANLKASEKEEYGLWKSLWTTQGAERAKVAMTLVNTMFPDGNPGKWEQVSGLFGYGYNLPRQLAAIDALFVAIDELSKNDTTIWGAALLLQQFGESAYGKIMFVEQTTPQVKAIIENIVPKTCIPGDWTIKRLRGKMPFLPKYDGKRSHNTAETMGYIYFDNYGSLTAGYGDYGWDRDRGLFYQIFEENGGRGLGGRL